LLTLAEMGGFDRATDLLQLNLNEEEAMADWLRENLHDVTLRFIQLSDAGHDAKV
jgi:ferritin-like metal-binding protein YciE